MVQKIGNSNGNTKVANSFTNYSLDERVFEAQEGGDLYTHDYIHMFEGISCATKLSNAFSV